MSWHRTDVRTLMGTPSCSTGVCVCVCCITKHNKTSDQGVWSWRCGALPGTLFETQALYFDLRLKYFKFNLEILTLFPKWTIYIFFNVALILRRVCVFKCFTGNTCRLILKCNQSVSNKVSCREAERSDQFLAASPDLTAGLHWLVGRLTNRVKWA